MRQIQEEIITAVTNKRNYCGSNVSVVTINNKTEVTYYFTKIAIVNHKEKTAKFNNGGFNNASTTAHINAVKMACDKLKYKY